MKLSGIVEPPHVDIQRYDTKSGSTVPHFKSERHEKLSGNSGSEALLYIPTVLLDTDRRLSCAADKQSLYYVIKHNYDVT